MKKFKFKVLKNGNLRTIEGLKKEDLILRDYEGNEMEVTRLEEVSPGRYEFDYAPKPIYKNRPNK